MNWSRAKSPLGLVSAADGATCQVLTRSAMYLNAATPSGVSNAYVSSFCHSAPLEARNGPMMAWRSAAELKPNC